MPERERLGAARGRCGPDAAHGAAAARGCARAVLPEPAARARDADVLIIDTAGRLHTKLNLMEELKKVNRVMELSYIEHAIYQG